VVPIILPPLRDRQEDVFLLLDHFLKESNKLNDRKVKFSRPVMDFLSTYGWPGNVRELQNLVERLVIMADSKPVSLNALPSYMLQDAATERTVPSIPAGATMAPVESSVSTVSTRLDDIERRQVEAALKRHGWVRARAARELGITQRQIGYRIKKYDLQPPDYI